jgi:undecaprenyl diphosphate synthase
MATATQALGLDPARLPRHVAVIMDGNGRWARKRGLPRVAGHQRAMESVRAVVKGCSSLGIPYLTLYAFSTENWRRPKAEVGFLMRLLATYLRKELADLHANGVRVRGIGDLAGLPEACQRELAAAAKRTARNRGLTLNLAVNYGGRQEILAAARQAMRLARNGKLSPAELDEQAFGSLLATAGAPDPDLLIRTSGEMRLSNFLLWQAAYAEIYVTPVLWPDFGRPQLIEALRDYQGRERRFGDIRAAAPA